MIDLPITIFVASAAAVTYALIGYPLLAATLALVIRREAQQSQIEPTVTFLIAAYNEQDVIEEKLKQTLALDYPPERLEIIVASDGSTDATDDIVRGFANKGVKLVRTQGRLGKTATLNHAIRHATGEILIFSDATGKFSSNAIRELTSYFADPSVGCVTGRVAYDYGHDTTSHGFKVYQRFAVFVRRCESAWGSETSVSGSIHAMRRCLYREAHPGSSLDVIDAVNTVAAGQRVLYAYDAVSLEQSRRSLADEFRCRVRIGVRCTSMIPYIVRTLVSNGRLVYLFQMISHKFLRWWLWLGLIALLLSNAYLAPRHSGWLALLALQVTGYLLASVAILMERRQRALPGLSGLALFVVGNAAMLIGALKAIAGNRMPKWEPVR